MFRWRERTVVLLVLLCLGIPRTATAQSVMTVRVTGYALVGVTYSCPHVYAWQCQESGHYTGPGVAACSWNMPEGTQLLFWDGRVVTCLDRGVLGWSGWVDVWVPYASMAWALESQYGSYTEVTVLRWGY